MKVYLKVFLTGRTSRRRSCRWHLSNRLTLSCLRIDGDDELSRVLVHRVINLLRGDLDNLTTHENFDFLNLWHRWFSFKILPTFQKKLAMPIHLVTITATTHGYQWGNHGKIYTFSVGDQYGEQVAYESAQRQARAAYAHGYR